MSQRVRGDVYILFGWIIRYRKDHFNLISTPSSLKSIFAFPQNLQNYFWESGVVTKLSTRSFNAHRHSGIPHKSTNSCGKLDIILFSYIYIHYVGFMVVLSVVSRTGTRTFIIVNYLLHSLIILGLYCLSASHSKPFVVNPVLSYIHHFMNILNEYTYTDRLLISFCSGYLLPSSRIHTHTLS